MAESKKKKNRTKTNKTTKVQAPIEPTVTPDQDFEQDNQQIETVIEEQEVFEVDFTPTEIKPEPDYGITKRTSSGSQGSNVMTVLKSSGSAAAQGLRRPSFWLWTGSIVVILLLLAIIWWQWQRSYVAVVNGQYVPTSALVNNAIINSGSQVLPNLTQQYLIEQEAHRLGVTVSQEVMDKELQSIKDDSGGEDGYQEALSQYGIPESYIISQIRTRQLLVAMVKDKITITDEDVRKHYDDNKDTIDPDGSRGFDNIKDLVRTELVEQRQEAEFATLVKSLQEKAQISSHLDHANLTFSAFLKNEILSIPADIANLFKTLTGQK